jgi:hypothetical protein
MAGGDRVYRGIRLLLCAVMGRDVTGGRVVLWLWYDQVPSTMTVGAALPLNKFSDLLRDEIARAG